MIEKIKKALQPAYDFMLAYYNSILLSVISTWLAYVLFTVGHAGVGALMLAIVLIKIIGVALQNRQLRQIGIIGLNIMWAVNTYVFARHHVPVTLTWHFPLAFLLLGVGIALRGRFNAR